MDLTILDIVDWEPCTVRFIFAAGSRASASVQQFIDRWLTADRASLGCSCKYRYSLFTIEDEKGSVTLNSEWLCSRCAQALADAGKDAFPELVRVELGIRREQSVIVDSGFIRVPSKEVEFEDGHRAGVDSFLIARRYVTVGEFETFVAASGYVTVAERACKAETFRSHCGFSGLSGPDRMDLAAQFIALPDAEAYCAHIGCRLPTEAEWLAAAIQEPVAVDMNPLEVLLRSAGPKPANALVGCGWDITSTVVPGSGVVARRGPLEFINQDWRESLSLKFHRRLIARDHFDMSITFRVGRD